MAVEAACKNAAMNSQTAKRGLIAHGKNRHRDTDNRRKSETSVKTGQVISAVSRKADGRTDGQTGRRKKDVLELSPSHLLASLVISNLFSLMFLLILLVTFFASVLVFKFILCLPDLQLYHAFAFVFLLQTKATEGRVGRW